jgi:hypothetical protein
MLLMGTDANPKRLLTIPESDLLYHTAVIGQSGSGKSYFIARLLEEITLRTHARIVILDPNGDFSRFHSPRERDFWEKSPFAYTLKQLKALTTAERSYDDYDSFCEVWNKRRFQFVTAGHAGYAQLRNGAYRAPLLIHWKWLESEQDFLLNVDPIVYPKIHQGILTCYHYMRDTDYDYPQGYSLKDLEEVAEYFATKRVAMAKYPEAHALTEEDWLAVRLQFRQLRKKYYRLWYWAKLKGLDSAPTDLSGYILSAFRKANPWQLCVVGLAALEVDDMLLAADAALSRLWKSALHVWKKAQERISEEAEATSAETSSESQQQFFMDNESKAELDENEETVLVAELDEEPLDQRVPTIIVIDEAHNFAPQEPTSQLQARVSDKIATIAAEGRKYGLFLLLATQRPQKLRKGLLYECENSCLLRLQSKAERGYAAEALGVPSETVEHIGRLEKGEALMTGRWVQSSNQFVRFAPARTMLGGSGIDEQYWRES